MTKRIVRIPSHHYDKINRLRKMEPELNIMKAIYRETPAAFVMLTPDFTIQSANQFVTNFTRHRAEDMIGRKCYDLFGDGHICRGCAVEKCMQTGKLERNIKKEASPDGDAQFILQRAVPIFKNGQLVNILEIVVDRTEQEKLEFQLHSDFLDTIEILSSMIELRDPYTGGHSKSVKHISVRIAGKLGLPSGDLQEISIAAVLHDIGKIAIKDDILYKKGTLTGEEFILIKRHPEIGEDALRKVERFAGPRKIILHHHERYDGCGYPDGLMGNEIPIGSRILAVADSYDAMTSDRSYRKAMSHEEASREIQEHSGTQFDPTVVEAFLRIW